MKRYREIGLILLMLILSGCGKLTEANYAKLKSGMSYDEVVQVLGRADKCSETLGLKHCIWGDDARNITADFLTGKALIFSSSNIH